MNAKKKLGCTVALAGLLAASNASAISVSGNLNPNGYDTINFSVLSPSIVDFQFTGGIIDPVFSLFDSSGQHLITNDDEIIGSSWTLWSHITQNLAAGSYSLVVSECCGFFSAGINNNTGTDGFNSGSYFTGSTTLSGLQGYFDTNQTGWYGGLDYPYSLNISGDVSLVPEPETYAMLLVGLGLMAFSVTSRKRISSLSQASI